MHVFYSAVIILFALGHFIVISKFIPTRYKNYSLWRPWTFSERLGEFIGQWSVPLIMCCIFFGAVVGLAWVWGALFEKTQNYWWLFVLRSWKLALFLAVQTELIFFEDRLQEQMHESQSFKEVVIYLLVNRVSYTPLLDD